MTFFNDFWYKTNWAIQSHPGVVAIIMGILILAIIIIVIVMVTSKCKEKFTHTYQNNTDMYVDYSQPKY